MRKGSFIGMTAVLLTFSACAHQYDEEGMLSGTAYQERSGPPVSQYPIPAKDPKGTAYVMSLGLEPLSSPSGQPEQYLHLRVALENRSDETPWTLAPGDFTLALGGHNALRATYAKTTPAGPTVTIPKGQHAEGDVYYALPSTTEPGPSSRVTFVWPIHRGSETLTTSTDLNMMAGAEPESAYYEPVYQPGVQFVYGPGWWWGPYWDWPFAWWGGPWWWGGGAFFGPRFYGGFHRGGFYGGGFRGGGFHGGGFRGGGFHGGGFHGGGRR